MTGDQSMGGDTSQLQRLTDEQVSARLAAYADNGRFEANLQWLWDQASDLIEEVSRSTLGEQAVKYEQERFTGKVDSSWVRNVAEYGVAMHVSKASVPQFIAASAAASRSEEHTSELQSRFDLVCRLLLEKKK